MKELLEDIEAGRVEAIICHDFTRLSRDEDGIVRAKIAEAEAGMRRLEDAIVAGATTVERARRKNMELTEGQERAARQLESRKHREELKVSLPGL